MALRAPDFVVGPFRQRDYCEVSAVVKDTAGVAIPGSSLSGFVYTLYNEADPFDIINAREQVDALTTVNASGEFTIALTADDMDIQDEDELTEKHRLLIEWEYAVPTRRGSTEIQIIVRNVLKVGT